MLIATYEKALGLLLSGQLAPRDAVVVADELQILGEPGRGPNIEALCAVLCQQGMGQFVALTATVENPGDLAGWMKCELTASQTRDIALHQEIWCDGRGYRVTFGQTDGNEIASKKTLPSGVIETVTHLLESKRGPVLVFTETRREASSYAKTYSQTRTRAADGIAVAEQLDLFSEPTEVSEQLRANAERRVAFHTADLTPQERQVIEQGFVDAKFEVCFATSTLAAGVNFPFKSVVFPKLTFQYGTRTGTKVPRSEYRNMSGRAGRLGMHDEGFAILLPRNSIELDHANSLVLPENDRVLSQLVSISMRRSILMLVASGLVSQREALRAFFQHTLYWYQTLDKNPVKLDEIIKVSEQALDWLIAARMVEQHVDTLLPTPLGKATSLSGLLPTTTATFVKTLAEHRNHLEDQFDEYIAGILHYACSSAEFRGDTPSRFLAYPTSQSPASTAYLSGRRLLQPLDRTDNQLTQCVHALILYVDGEAERKIAFTTNVSSGNLHRLALDVSWVLDGLHRLACVPDLGCSQKLANRIAMLSRRVRWGAPAEALDVIRIAERHGVPGFGRQRAMALVAHGLLTLEDILNSTKDKLLQILRSEPRTIALMAAVSDTVGLGSNRLAKTHRRVAKQLGIEHIVEDCNTKLGREYEDALIRLLKVESSWVVTVLDDGKRQNVPDVLVEIKDVRVLIECKTCTKVPALIKKEEAFAVMQKAADFDKNMRRVTLGRPAFDEHSKTKAQASSDVTLVEHAVFMEGLLRVHVGTVNPLEFLKWLGTPGVAEIDRLSGKATYAVA